MGNENFALEGPLDLGSVRRFEKQLQCLRQIAPCFFDGVALTGDVQFGTEGDIAVSLSLNDGHKMLKLFHSVLHIMRRGPCEKTRFSA